MNKDEFGKHVWISLHALAGWCFTQEKRNAFADMVKNLQQVFPCDKCASHLALTMVEYPIDNYLDSAENLLRWTYIAHTEASKHFNNDPDNRGSPRKKMVTWESVKQKYLGEPDEDDGPQLRTYITSFRRR